MSQSSILSEQVVEVTSQVVCDVSALSIDNNVAENLTMSSSGPFKIVNVNESER